MSLNLTKYNSHWDDKTLSELGNFSRGKSKHRPRNDIKLFENGKYPLIQTGDIKQSILHIAKHETNYNDFGLSQSKIWPEGTLCITIAANIAETGVLSYPMCFPDSVVGFNANENDTSEAFIHYVFSYIRKIIQRATSGSIQDNINIDYLTRLKLKIPRKEYQNKIVKLLASIDQKIEINLKSNEEYERLVKDYYSYWFIQFDFPDESGAPYKTAGGKLSFSGALNFEIPDGWTALKLSDFLRFHKGYEPGADSYLSQTRSGLIKFYRVGDIDGDCQTFVDMNIKNLVTVNQNDIVVTFDGSVGKIGLGLEGAISGGLRKIVDETDTYTSALIWAIFLDPRIQLTIKRFSTGSILLHASDAIDQLYIPFNKDKFLELQKIIDPIHRQTVANIVENQKLNELRDWLLPMLMTGQVGIK